MTQASLFLAVLSAGVGVCVGGSGCVTGVPADQPRQYPRDLGNHPAWPSEGFYFAAHAFDDAGNSYGIVSSLSRATTGDCDPTGVATDNALDMFVAYKNLSAPGDAPPTIVSTTWQQSTENVTLSMTTLDVAVGTKWVLSLSEAAVAAVNLSFSLGSSPTGVLEGPLDGCSPTPGDPSHCFIITNDIPRMPAVGYLEGTQLKSPFLWYSHSYYGLKSAALLRVGWYWHFGMVQAGDTLIDFSVTASGLGSHGSIRVGNTTHACPKAWTLENSAPWTSPATNMTYPTTVRIMTNCTGTLLDVTLEVFSPNCELVLDTVVGYEAAASVRGTYGSQALDASKSSGHIGHGSVAL